MKRPFLAVLLSLSLSFSAYGFDLNSLLKDKAENVLQGVISGDIRSVDDAINAAIPSVTEVSESLTGEAFAGSGEITMYVTPTCGYCKKAERYMSQNGVRYNRRDVTKNKSAMNDFRELGGRGVPLITVGDEQMAGFDAQRFEKMRQRNGL
ncbi:glutaredoxin family protein [Amphritea balenae]|uniref:Glutaredoxin domain-containing protein n=1 Tax=Amphritea balenae TaxID=452629 RepID=A0A3P1SN88_9GAMM|nr:glutaredoxin domain-containing protein [Amphritea balenae]RRC98618.1 hypothetical protein EHS89_13485 [Amphritea balenae]GGK65978.1 hypothetical protein GCM10007941_15260 [Amphritea balenae]